VFKGVKKVLSDFIDAFRREIGDIKVFDETENVEVKILGGELGNVNIKESNFSFEIQIEEESAKTDSVSFYVNDIELKECPCSISDLSEGTEVEIRDFFSEEFGESPNVSDFEFEKLSCNTRELYSFEEFMKTIKFVDMFEEFNWNLKSNEIEAGNIHCRIFERSIFPVAIIKSSDSVWANIPIVRRKAFKSDYSRESIKSALEFILERIEGHPKLKFVGIYRDIPLDKVKRMNFERDKMEFTLRKATNMKGVILDVLVVMEEKAGKYHVGPIIRKN